MRRTVLLIILLLSVTAACTAAPTLTPAPAPAGTATRFSTPLPTASPASTPTPVVVTPTAPPPTPTKPEKITYVIQPGDTLIAIAEKFNVDVHALAVYNHIPNINYIVTGYALTIPEPGYVPPPPPPTITDGKQIVVELSSQQVFVYENGILLKTFTVSTGLPETPTVTGDYTILSKYDLYDMIVPGEYNLPNVPWVMYFYQGYSFHGTYWHHNFGYPMSHGCVNMETDDALWLYDWTPIGTAVHIVP